MARRKIIPKRVGGMKVPKSLRRLGDRALADPRAREVAGSALLALGAALASRGAPKGSVLRDIFDHPGRSARAAGEAGAEAAGKAGQAAGGVADAVSQAVGEVIEAVRRDLARKVRPVRPRHAHDEDEDRAEGDDRMH